MRFLMKPTRWACLALAGLIATAGSASAGWVPGFQGHTVTLLPGTAADGIINFGVYERTGATSWESQLGVTATGTGVIDATAAGFVVPDAFVDTGARYIYFYQVVNNDTLTPESIIDGLFTSLRIDPSQISSAGRLADTVFSDADGAVGPTTNQRLGSEVSLPDVLLDGVPSHLYASDPGFVSGVTAARDLSMITIDVHPGPGGGPALQFTFQGEMTGQFSEIFFVTSNVGPRYDRGSLQDGQYSVGDIPVAAPEPASIALMLCGAFGFGGYAGWRKIRRKGNPKSETATA